MLSFWGFVYCVLLAPPPPKKGVLVSIKYNMCRPVHVSDTRYDACVCSYINETGLEDVLQVVLYSTLLPQITPDTTTN